MIAGLTELGNDEVYYWTYALQPDWSHFDHPPMVGFCIRLTTLNLLLRDEIFIRLSAIVIAAVNTWLIYSIARKLSNKTAGLIAALFYNSSFYTSLIAGTFILPDTPLQLFWVLSLNTILDIFYLDNAKTGKFILLGIYTGLAILCKIHGLFILGGVILYVLLFSRKYLLGKGIYITVLISLVFLLPFLAWNYHNDFISFRFHSGRVGFFSGFHAASLLTEVSGELIYNNPVNIFFYIIVFLYSFRGKNLLPGKLKHILILQSVPVIVVFIFLSCFNDTLPHWSAPGYNAMMVYAAIFFAFHEKDKMVGILRFLKVNLMAVQSLILVALAILTLLPLKLGSNETQNLGDGDPTLDITGWKDLKKQFEQFRKNDIAQSRIHANVSIISYKWFPGAHLDFYVAQPLHLNFLCIGQLTDIHKYAWLNRERKPILPGEDAYVIAPSNYFDDPAQLYKDDFEKIEFAGRLPQYRNGVTVRWFFIFRLKNCR
jgi:4-amino-4-deoxy-L-arabinose transferase-like glycosyltransferase